MPHGLPSMDTLSEYLCNHLEAGDKNDKDSWSLIKNDLKNGFNLEHALKKQSLSDALLNKIVRLTWQCVNNKDKILLNDTALGKKKFSLGQLLQGIFRSTHTNINIVTTNYDRVAEYACNSRGIFFKQALHQGMCKNGKVRNRLDLNIIIEILGL